MSFTPQAAPEVIERRLLLLAGVFLSLWALAFSMSPAVRARSLLVPWRWDHWLLVLAWIGLAWFYRIHSRERLPGRDPLLFPAAMLLSGWGVLTIWRLYPSLGLRQTAWLLATGLAVWLVLRLPDDLAVLRRYKYVWLTAGLLLTGLTLFFGTNPLGEGPRLWLGCCGFYIQPSEPLKLLLIVYLSAYLAGLPADMLPASRPQSSALLSWLAPTLVMTGLALALLAAQRDLGTATIFLFIYAAVVFLATGKRRILVGSAAAILVAGVLGYYLFDLVRLRVEAWLNPWADPSGRSYQIVQSLISVANGGLPGRGPGLGAPNLVPVAHSDFIFTAISEETGLIGGIALLALFGLLGIRGLRAALSASDPFRRYLAAGLALHLVGQTLMIVAGNIRLLPLTGVTLPFVSYGGSSLVSSYLSLALLLKIGQRAEDSQPPALLPWRGFMSLGGGLLVGLGLAALTAGWWSVWRSPTLLARTDNTRRALADRFVPRGAILDRAGSPLAETTGQPGELTRRLNDPSLSIVVGYNHAVYGQSGLEAGLDEYLRGQRGEPVANAWINRLLYGQPPPGLDVRTTLHAGLQQAAYQALGELAGAVVLMDAENGEVMVMVSSPGFDANNLDETWEALINDPGAPLLNRALLGSYPADLVLEKLFSSGSVDISSLSAEIPFLGASPLAGSSPTQLSPLQAVLLAAAVSRDGRFPAPKIASALQTEANDWELLPEPAAPTLNLPAGAAAAALDGRTNPQGWGWQFTVLTPNTQGERVAWYLGGTLPAWTGQPLALALVLENSDPASIDRVADRIWQSALLK